MEATIMQYKLVKSWFKLYDKPLLTRDDWTQFDQIVKEYMTTVFESHLDEIIDLQEDILEGYIEDEMQVTFFKNRGRVMTEFEYSELIEFTSTCKIIPIVTPEETLTAGQMNWDTLMHRGNFIVEFGKVYDKQNYRFVTVDYYGELQ